MPDANYNPQAGASLQSPLNSLAALQAAALEVSLQNQPPGFNYGWGAPQVNPHPHQGITQQVGLEFLVHSRSSYSPFMPMLCPVLTQPLHAL